MRELDSCAWDFSTPRVLRAFHAEEGLWRVGTRRKRRERGMREQGTPAGGAACQYVVIVRWVPLRGGAAATTANVTEYITKSLPHYLSVLGT
jgi:hypothetical protein